MSAVDTNRTGVTVARLHALAEVLGVSASPLLGESTASRPTGGARDTGARSDPHAVA